MDPGLAEHIDWDKVYAILTHVIINIIDAYMTYGIKYNSNESQCVMDMCQGDILMDLTCLFALLVPLSIG